MEYRVETDRSVPTQTCRAGMKTSGCTGCGATSESVLQALAWNSVRGVGSDER